MDNQEIREILDKYLERVRGFFNLKMAILYGSYATGNPHEHSDIDVAIFVKKDEIGDLLEKEIFLFNLSSEVNIHIEPNLFYVEDLNDPEPASFVNHILKNGIILYNKNNKPIQSVSSTEALAEGGYNKNNKPIQSVSSTEALAEGGYKHGHD